ncbi:hypothetical protein [Planctomyces sp. SH-PL62]|uniref:hypothetical protein n=1 Tax=Planctomyces sp. SH-PL62 TaxID=1636152 RepID=UPI00078E8580|nr:hypothetical protein [Planctomyces sp. SH-PL62]AMV39906.1 hypothetical protein VT85_20910 [Planctomyces sp. SH-PL62]
MSIRNKILARRTVAALVVALAAIASGCSSGVAHPVDPGPAMDALKTVLDAWKEGKTPDFLKDAAPAIVVQDLEWLSGAKLESYQVEGDGVPADANLEVRVKLNLAAKGKKLQRDAHYLVTTSPALTVFRDMMR